MQIWASCWMLLPGGVYVVYSLKWHLYVYQSISNQFKPCSVCCTLCQVMHAKDWDCANTIKALFDTSKKTSSPVTRTSCLQFWLFPGPALRQTFQVTPKASARTMSTNHVSHATLFPRFLSRWWWVPVVPLVRNPRAFSRLLADPSGARLSSSPRERIQVPPSRPAPAAAPARLLACLGLAPLRPPCTPPRALDGARSGRPPPPAPIPMALLCFEAMACILGTMGTLTYTRIESKRSIRRWRRGRAVASFFFSVSGWLFGSRSRSVDWFGVYHGSWFSIACCWLIF